jgi:hypothetical protein
MPGIPGMAKQLGSGRKAGTPNRQTADVQAKLVALNCDPVEGLAMLAMNTTASKELRGKMYNELAQYIVPKRRAVEIEGNVEVQDNRTDDQIKAEIAAMASQLGIPLPGLGG